MWKYPPSWFLITNNPLTFSVKKENNSKMHITFSFQQIIVKKFSTLQVVKVFWKFNLLNIHASI